MFLVGAVVFMRESRWVGEKYLGDEDGDGLGMDCSL